MNITIDFGHNKVIPVTTKLQLIDKLNNSYPEMAMMLAMEECNELAIAISKCVRNGSDDKKDNLAEEIIDVLTVIQWAIRKFGITEEMLKKWYKYKSERLETRDKTDEIVFRSNKAREAYKSNRVDSQNQLVITRSKNSQYVASGDIVNALEYYHVLTTYLTKCGLLNPSHMDDITEDTIKCILGDEILSSKNDNSATDNINWAESTLPANEGLTSVCYDNDKFVNESPLRLTSRKEESKKMPKRTARDLDKLVEKASKKAKHIDSSKKKDDKKKKGKKGKK